MWCKAFTCDVQEVPESTWHTLVEQCVRLQQVRETRVAAGDPPTFWTDAGASRDSTEGLCALEALARSVFWDTVEHVGAKPNPQLRSGAEWWVLCLNRSTGRVLWHWDGDWENLALNKHALAATVSYFTTGGVSTAVVPARQKDIETAASCYYLAKPSRGMHLAFDGRLLHGAAPELCARCEGAEPGSLRVTFLVNVWVNHKPSTAFPFEEDERRTVAGSEVCPVPYLPRFRREVAATDSSSSPAYSCTFGDESTREERFFDGAEHGRTLCISPRSGDASNGCKDNVFERVRAAVSVKVQQPSGPPPAKRQRQRSS